MKAFVSMDGRPGDWLLDGKRTEQLCYIAGADLGFYKGGCVL